MKTCSKCKQELPLDHFGKRKAAKDGLDSWCKSCRTAHHKEWVAKNREHYLSYAKPLWKAHRAWRRAAMESRSYPEYTTAIRDIYRNCPAGHHVDHIVPLKGKLVSGLHVPWNLQYLPAVENIRKSNHFQI